MDHVGQQWQAAGVCTKQHNCADLLAMRPAAMEAHLRQWMMSAELSRQAGWRAGQHRYSYTGLVNVYLYWYSLFRNSHNASDHSFKRAN